MKRLFSFKIYHRNIRSPATEIFKIKNNLSVTIMNDIFQPRTVSHNSRSQTDFTRPNVNSEHFGISSLKYKFEIWYIMIGKMEMTLKLLKTTLENEGHLTVIASYI